MFQVIDAAHVFDGGDLPPEGPPARREALTVARLRRSTGVSPGLERGRDSRAGPLNT